MSCNEYIQILIFFYYGYATFKFNKGYKLEIQYLTCKILEHYYNFKM